MTFRIGKEEKMNVLSLAFLEDVVPASLVFVEVFEVGQLALESRYFAFPLTYDLTLLFGLLLGVMQLKITLVGLFSQITIHKCPNSKNV